MMTEVPTPAAPLGAPDDDPVGFLRFGEVADQIRREVLATDLAEYDETLDQKFQARAEAQIRAASDPIWHDEHHTEAAMLEWLDEHRVELERLRALARDAGSVAFERRAALAQLPPAPHLVRRIFLHVLLVGLAVLATAGVTVVLAGSLDHYVLRDYLADAGYGPGQITMISLWAAAIIAGCVLAPLAALTLGSAGDVRLRTKVAYLVFAEVLFAVAFALIRMAGGADSLLGSGWALFEIAIAVAYTLAVGVLSVALRRASEAVERVRQAEVVAGEAAGQARELEQRQGAVERAFRAQLHEVARRQECLERLETRVTLARETASLAYWLTILELQAQGAQQLEADFIPTVDRRAA